MGLIQCPITRKSLRLVSPEELLRLQERKRSSSLFNALGRVVTIPIADGYISEAAACFFPKVDGVVWLVAEEAISLENSSH
jgi:uncharacterized protein YbaR (Trm112 family)